MFGQVFAKDILRKYVVYFGTLFSDLVIVRDDEDSREQTFKVPLNYGPSEKYLARTMGNPDGKKEIAITLPRMSFEMTNFYYDPTRKLPSLLRNTAQDPANPSKKLYQYAPIPYNIEFTLYILTKNVTDGTRILEQIVPFFTPDYTATLTLDEELNSKYDIPLILDAINNEDSYEGNFESRRAIIWTLRFTMKAWLFGPVKSGSVITQVIVNFKLPEDVETADESYPNSVVVTVTPGLTANGQPTSNSSLTIARNLIKSTDNYGFITDIMDNV